MTDQEHKVVENRLRRAAARQGLRLEKSRRRDPRALGFGTYQLVDEYTRFIVHADHVLQRGFGLDLEDVADWLADGIIDVLVYDGPDHEMAKWIDENNFDGKPFIHYRHGCTTMARARDGHGRPLPDGWVLYNPADSSEEILGVWADADEAVAAAKDYLRGLSVSPCHLRCRTT